MQHVHSRWVIFYGLDELILYVCGSRMLTVTSQTHYLKISSPEVNIIKFKRNIQELKTNKRICVRPKNCYRGIPYTTSHPQSNVTLRVAKRRGKTKRQTRPSSRELWITFISETPKTKNKPSSRSRSYEPRNQRTNPRQDHDRMKILTKKDNEGTKRGRVPFPIRQEIGAIIYREHICNIQFLSPFP